MNDADLRVWFLRAIPLAVLLAVWQFLAWWLHGLLFPTVTQTVVACARLVTTPMFWRAWWLSHQALVIGFAVSTTIGIVIGLIIGRSSSVDALVDPYLMMLIVTPMSAVIPLVIISFGVGLLARALVVAMFSLVVIIINTRAGVRSIDPGWVEMVRSFGAGEAQIWRTVVIPGALPSIITGLRLGLSRAFTGMVAAELLLVSVGVGRLILNFQGSFESGSVYAVVIVMVVEVLILLNALSRLERRLSPAADDMAVE